MLVSALLQQKNLEKIAVYMVFYNAMIPLKNTLQSGHMYYFTDKLNGIFPINPVIKKFFFHCCTLKRLMLGIDPKYKICI